MNPSRLTPNAPAALPALALALVLGLTAAPAPARAADALPQLTRLLADSDDAQFQIDLLRGISAALKGRRSAPMPAGWEAVETRLGGSANAEVRTLTQTLSLTFGSTRALGALRVTAADTAATADARRTALESLLAARPADLAPLLQKLAADPAVAATAIRGLAAYDDAGSPAAILAIYGSLNASVRRDALNTLASRVAFARPLLAAVSDRRVPRTDLTADLVRQLRNLKDEELTRQIGEVWGVMNETSPDMQTEVERVKRLYWAGGSQPGEASRGRVVFNKVCAQCHHLFDTGGAVGPDITGANRSDLDYLLQNILFPNAVIPNEYRQSLVETTDGRVISGIVKEQNAAAIIIQAANELVTLPRAEVRKIELSDISMMPEGLITGLTEQELRDLLYYLGRPGQVPLAEGK